MTGEDYLNKFRYTNKIVAFVDVLGFKKAILEDVDDERRIIARLDEAFTWSINQIPLEEEEWFSIKLFSDCICFSCDPTPKNLAKLLLEVSNWHKVFLVYQRFLRGAITFGKHFESERIIFSKAMLEAYQLEQSVAKYPRVIVSDSVFAILSDADEQTIGQVNAFIRRDRDGQNFVDYFHYIIVEDLSPLNKRNFLLIHRDAIRFQIKNESDASILTKYKWVAQYHNEARYRLLNRNDYSEEEYQQILLETEISMDSFPHCSTNPSFNE